MEAKEAPTKCMAGASVSFRELLGMGRGLHGDTHSDHQARQGNAPLGVCRPMFDNPNCPGPKNVVEENIRINWKTSIRSPKWHLDFIIFISFMPYLPLLLIDTGKLNLILPCIIPEIEINISTDLSNDDTTFLIVSR